MPASPKRQQATKSVQGLLSAPPQARPQTGGPAMSAPQTGGPVYGQGMSPRQEQRAQYLATHPNARGNQPQQTGQAPRPQQTGQPMQQTGQMPQGGFQPMPRPIQGGGGYGAPMGYPQTGFDQTGVLPTGWQQTGVNPAINNPTGVNPQNPGQWQNPQLNNMNWSKFGGWF